MPRRDLHAHQCPKCEHVWEHFLSQIPEAEYDHAHECPKCGTESRTHYEPKGGFTAMSCHNGARTIDYALEPAVITAEERSSDHTERDVLNLVQNGRSMGPIGEIHKPFGGIVGILLPTQFEMIEFGWPDD